MKIIDLEDADEDVKDENEAADVEKTKKESGAGDAGADAAL